MGMWRPGSCCVSTKDKRMGKEGDTSPSKSINSIFAIFIKIIFCYYQISRAELISTWEDSPDRYLLELGGVKTNRPREQQQQ